MGLQLSSADMAAVSPQGNRLGHVGVSIQQVRGFGLLCMTSKACFGMLYTTGVALWPVVHADHVTAPILQDSLTCNVHVMQFALHIDYVMISVPQVRQCVVGKIWMPI